MYIHKEKKERCKLTSQTQLYLCANQLHVSALYSHHKAAHRTVTKKNYNKIQCIVAGWHTDKVLLRLRVCIFPVILTFVSLKHNGNDLSKKRTMIFPSWDSIFRSSADESSALPVHRPRYPGKSNVTSHRRNLRNDAAKLRLIFYPSLSKKLPVLWGVRVPNSL